MTVLQQQQRKPASPPTVSPGACHAFSLYCESVAAGQWVKLTIEQRPEGETFHVSSRPWAAAPAAARARTKEKKARRRPNKKRLAAKQLWRESRGSGTAAAVPRQQQQQQLCQQFCQPAATATAASGTYAQVAATAASPAKAAASVQQPSGRTNRQRQPAPASSQQLQQAPVRAAAAARTRQPAAASSHSPQQQEQLEQTARRTWAALPAASATAIRLVSTVESSQASQPSLYRARSDSDVFMQLDGEANSPQSSQDQQPGGAPESPPSPASEPSPLEEAPPLITPPPEPDDVLEACLDRIHRKLHAGMYVEDCTRCQDSAI